ncbi:hypothetical protein C0J52_25445 [Blattella germanica]|nr:hypothetical protein C0J52_25445 [Blattella germanica]
MPASLLPYLPVTIGVRSPPAGVPMLAMSTLMMPAATMTTMTNPGPIPVAQAKFAAGGGGGGGGAVTAAAEPNGKLAPINHTAPGNKSDFGKLVRFLKYIA